MEVAEMTDAELESAFLDAVGKLDAEQLQAVGEMLAGLSPGSLLEG
jgi:DNA-binding protein YbaB